MSLVFDKIKIIYSYTLRHRFKLCLKRIQIQFELFVSNSEEPITLWLWLTWLCLKHTENYDCLKKAHDFFSSQSATKDSRTYFVPITSRYISPSPSNLKPHLVSVTPHPRPLIAIRCSRYPFRLHWRHDLTAKR